MEKDSRTGNIAIFPIFFIIILMICLTSTGPVVNAASYQIEYYTLARNVDKGVPSGEPIFVTDSGLGAVFLTTDSYVYSYIRFKEISGPFILKTEWYSPDGQLYASTESKDETSKTYNGYWAWSRITVAGKIDEEKSGLWIAKVYINDEPIITSKFLILTPYLAWRFVEAYGEIKEANQALENILNEYRQKIDESNQEIAILKSKNAELESRNRELENNLAEAKAEYEKLSQEYLKVASEKDSMKTEVDTLQEKLKNTQAELDSLNVQRLLALIAAIVFASVAIVAIVFKLKKA